MYITTCGARSSILQTALAHRAGRLRRLVFHESNPAGGCRNSRLNPRGVSLGCFVMHRSILPLPIGSVCHAFPLTISPSAHGLCKQNLQPRPPSGRLSKYGFAY